MRQIFIFFISLFFLLFLLAPVIFASEHLPQGLLVAQAYEQEQAQQFTIQVSFLIAFLAGILTLLSPCLLPLIPAFFSYTFKEKKQITYMTLVFFAGFTLMFTAMGIGATLIGNTAVTLLQKNSGIFIQIAGAVMILFGLFSLLGKGFSGVILRRRTTHDTLGVFLYGIFFAIGWTACVGPILVGMLSMVTVFHNYLTAITLMFFYSLGMFVPIFLFCFFYDSHHIEKMKWMKGKIYHFEFRGKTHSLHTSNLVSGILFLLLGTTFIVFKGTGIVNGITYFGIKDFFYTLQRYLLQGGWKFNLIGLVVLILVIYVIYNAITITREEVK